MSQKDCPVSNKPRQNQQKPTKTHPKNTRMIKIDQGEAQNCPLPSKNKFKSTENQSKKCGIGQSESQNCFDLTKTNQYQPRIDQNTSRNLPTKTSKSIKINPPTVCRQAKSNRH